MNASHPPRHLSTFPAEILSVIFTKVVAASEVSVDAITALKDVCSYWRAVIVNNHALWRTLQLNYSEHPFVDGVGVAFGPRFELYNVVNRFMANTLLPKPTTLILRIPYNNQLRKTLYKPSASDINVFEKKFSEDGWLEEQVMTRIRSAEFSFDPILALNLFVALPIDHPRRPMLTSWTQLTTLTLIATAGHRMPLNLLEYVCDGYYLSVSMPKLVNLSLVVHELVPWVDVIPWGQLKRLSLRVEREPIDDIVKILHKCQRNLVQLTLRAVTFLPPPGADDSNANTAVPVKFPALRMLRMEVLSTVVPGPGTVWGSPPVAVADALHYLFKAVELPEVQAICLHHALATVRVDHSIFMQFIGACTNLSMLCLGGLKFVVPKHIESDALISKSVKEGRIFTSVMGSLPRTISHLAIISAHYKDPAIEFPQLHWLSNISLDAGWFLPSLRSLHVGLGVPVRKLPVASHDSLMATLGQFARRRRLEKKPIRFKVSLIYEETAKKAFYALYEDESDDEGDEEEDDEEEEDGDGEEEEEQGEDEEEGGEEQGEGEQEDEDEDEEGDDDYEGEGGVNIEGVASDSEELDNGGGDGYVGQE